MKHCKIFGILLCLVFKYLTLDFLAHNSKSFDGILKIIIFKFFFWIKILNLYFNLQKEYFKNINSSYAVNAHKKNVCTKVKRQEFEDRGSIIYIYG